MRVFACVQENMSTQDKNIRKKMGLDQGKEIQCKPDFQKKNKQKKKDKRDFRVCWILWVTTMHCTLMPPKGTVVNFDSASCSVPSCKHTHSVFVQHISNIILIRPLCNRDGEM